MMQIDAMRVHMNDHFEGLRMPEAIREAVTEADGAAYAMELTQPSDCLGRLDDPMHTRRAEYIVARRKLVATAMDAGRAEAYAVIKRFFEQVRRAPSAEELATLEQLKSL